MRERKAATNGDRARGRPSCAACIARRILRTRAEGAPARIGRSTRPPNRGQMFESVSAKPDFAGQEHEVLARWREARTFERLRAQNAGGPRWSFLDGPITANNPMGVHHA